MTKNRDRLSDYSRQLRERPDDDSRRHANDAGDAPLPASRGANAVPLDRSGINDNWIDKRGTPSGLDAALLHLPPGMNIEDQRISRADEAGDIPYKEWKGHDRGYVEVGSANSPTRKK